MFRGKFLIGSVFVVTGIAWPTVSITRGLTQYSHVCCTAITEHRELQAPQKQDIVIAIEQAGASVIGGFVMVLFGIGVALGSKRDPRETPAETSQTVEI